MALNDVYEVIDVQQYDGQKMLNVYFYQQRAPLLAGNIPQQLADTFETNVIPVVALMQTGDVLHTEIRVRNLFNESEAALSPISIAGTSSAEDTAAPFVAVGFRLRQDNASLRNGAKRIGGAGDTFDSDGVISSGGAVAAAIAVGAAMILGLDVGVVSDAFLPVIVKRLLDGGNYRLPENSGESVIGTVVDALFNANTTSQVSRKIGRGV